MRTIATLCRRDGQKRSMHTGLDASLQDLSSPPASREILEGEQYASDVEAAGTQQPDGPSEDAEPGSSSRGEASSSSKVVKTKSTRLKPSVDTSPLEHRPSNFDNAETRRSSRLSKRPSLMPGELNVMLSILSLRVYSGN